MASGHSKGHHEVQNDSTNSNEVGFDSEEDKINKLSTRVSPPHLKQNETKKQSAVCQLLSILSKRTFGFIDSYFIPFSLKKRKPRSSVN